MIDDQANDIMRVRELVARAPKADGLLSEKAKMDLIDRMRTLYPSWPLEMVVDIDLAALAAEPA